MKVTNLIDSIFLVEDILDLQNYPEIFNTVKEEAGFNKKGRSGRRMCRMTNPGMKYYLFGKAFAKKDYTQSVQKIRTEIEKSYNLKMGTSIHALLIIMKMVHQDFVIILTECLTLKIQ